jgi:hypothetical protein
VSEAPRRTSSLAFQAVNARMDGLVEKLVARFAPYLRGTDVDPAFLARIARGEAFDANTDSYRKGVEVGDRAVREHYGLPIAGVSDDEPTRPVPRCQHCGR